MLISEEIEPVAIAITIIELRLSERISLSVNQSASQQKILKFLAFHINLVVGFRVDLKTFLS